MPKSFDRSYGEWGVEELLQVYRGLALRPRRGDGLTIAGILEFTAGGNRFERLTDTYDVRISVPGDYPRRLPRIYECGGRVPRDFHKLEDDALCLASPIRLRLKLGMRPTLLEYVDKCVVPYLYGYAYYGKHGKLPFEELDHDNEGINAELRELLDAGSPETAQRLLWLASLERRKANRHSCPCGSGLRVGNCHHLKLTRLRRRCGRFALRAEYLRLTGGWIP